MIKEITTKQESSQARIRAKIQELISENTRPAIGRFHSKELDEKGLTNDLLKYFNINSK